MLTGVGMRCFVLRTVPNGCIISACHCFTITSTSLYFYLSFTSCKSWNYSMYTSESTTTSIIVLLQLADRWYCYVCWGGIVEWLEPNPCDSMVPGLNIAQAPLQFIWASYPYKHRTKKCNKDEHPHVKKQV